MGGGLFKLLPEGFVLLVIASFFRGGWVVLNEPCEELGVVNLFAEHFLTAGGVM